LRHSLKIHENGYFRSIHSIKKNLFIVTSGQIRAGKFFSKKKPVSERLQPLDEGF